MTQTGEMINEETIYQQAKDKFMHYASAEDLREATRLFEQISEYKSAKQYLEKCATLLEYMVGNEVTFGHWDGVPVRWRVMDLRGKMRMLTTERALLRRPYHDVVEDATWQTCDLRKWLNGAFLNECFTVAERTKIVPTKIANVRNPKFFTNAGMDTMDKVSVMNIEEVEKYYPELDRRAGDGWWWVRSPGSNLFSAVAVYEDGTIYDTGIHIDYAQGGVRPVIWVLLRV